MLFNEITTICNKKHAQTVGPKWGILNFKEGGTSSKIISKCWHYMDKTELSWANDWLILTITGYTLQCKIWPLRYSLRLIVGFQNKSEQISQRSSNVLVSFLFQGEASAGTQPYNRPVILLSRFAIYNSHFTWIYISHTVVKTSQNIPKQQCNNRLAFYQTTFWE